jgi:hypothetical protein
MIHIGRGLIMKSKLLAVAASVLLASVANAAIIDFEDGTAPVNGPVPVHSYNVGGIQISFANATYSAPAAGYFLSIEKDFIRTINFVELSPANKSFFKRVRQIAFASWKRSRCRC